MRAKCGRSLSKLCTLLGPDELSIFSPVIKYCNYYTTYLNALQQLTTIFHIK